MWHFTCRGTWFYTTSFIGVGQLPNSSFGFEFIDKAKNLTSEAGQYFPTDVCKAFLIASTSEPLVFSGCSIILNILSDENSSSFGRLHFGNKWNSFETKSGVRQLESQLGYYILDSHHHIPKSWPKPYRWKEDMQPQSVPHFLVLFATELIHCRGSYSVCFASHYFTLWLPLSPWF